MEYVVVVCIGVLLGCMVRGSAAAALTLIVCTVIVEFAFFFSLYNLDLIRMVGLLVATSLLQLATFTAIADARQK